MRLSPLVALLIVLAGCLGGGRPDYEAIDAQATEEALAALEPAVDGLPAASSFNLDLVAYHNGVDDSGEASALPAGGRYTELAVTDEYVYLARSSQGAGLPDEGAFGGFSIIDIRELEDPVLAGVFPALGGSDIEVDDAGATAFFSTQRNTVEELVGGATANQDPTSILPRGIYVVDVTDKHAPAFASFFPVPYNGVHTIEYVRHPGDGDEYLVACTYDLYANTFPSTTLGAVNTAFPEGVFPLTQRVIVFQIERPDGAPVYLRPVSTFQLLDQPPSGQMYFPHDTFVQEHPVTGRVLLYVAYWDLGVRILDFDDPTAGQLQEIGSYDDFRPSMVDQIHQVLAFPEVMDGRHVTVAEPEIPSADETGQITIIDTTDPARPQRLGWWTQPHPDLVTSGFDHSPHNMDLRDGLILLSHQELGLWVIDVSDHENMEDPKTVGYHFSRHGGNETDHAVWGAFWLEHPDGPYVVASDTPTGMQILRYTGPRA